MSPGTAVAEPMASTAASSSALRLPVMKTCAPSAASRTDAGRLARYLMTVPFGIAVQAASGISRDDLQEVADTALRNWPPT